MTDLTLPQLAERLAVITGISGATMSGYVRALRKARLVTHGGDALASVDAAVWLLLALLAGSVKSAVKVAGLLNSRQTVGGVLVNDGEPEMRVFDAVRDLINLRRAGLLIVQGDLRLAVCGAAISVSIYCEALDGRAWSFSFGPPLDPAEPSPALWQLTVVSPRVIDHVAAYLGPLPESIGPTLNVLNAFSPVRAIPEHQVHSTTVH